MMLKIIQKTHLKNMIQFSNENQFSFPYLVDETQEIAKTYDAVCTQISLATIKI